MAPALLSLAIRPRSQYSKPYVTFVNLSSSRCSKSVAPRVEIKVSGPVPQVEDVVLPGRDAYLALHLQGPPVGAVRVEEYVVERIVRTVALAGPFQAALASVQHDVTLSVRLLGQQQRDLAGLGQIAPPLVLVGWLSPVAEDRS